MAQLRHEYETFKQLNTEILVMVPNGPKMIGRYLDSHNDCYPILTDKGARVAESYFQTKRFFSWGTPTVFLVDQGGTIRYAHYAASMIEEPDNREVLELLRSMK